MTSLEEKIKEIEDEIEKTPYNKASQHHIGKLKAKLSKLREEHLKRTSKGGRGYGFGLKKEGHATVVIMGFPSVGKSTLLNKLTNADSPVGTYDFTTLDVIPGMMEYKGVNFQLLDVPGIIGGAAKGKGRGKEVLAVARIADLIVLLVDARKMGQVKDIVDELEGVGVRLNKKPAKISIRRTKGGGIHILSRIKLAKIDEQTARSVANAYGIHNAEISVGEDVSVDDLVDAFNGNRIYIPLLVAVNKIDLAGGKELGKVRLVSPDSILISAEGEVGLSELRDTIFRTLGFMRVYMKPQGEKADLVEPLILEASSSIRDLCGSLHKEFLSKFRYGVVWGKSVKHEGQRVGLNHKLKDGDIVSIIKKL